VTSLFSLMGGTRQAIPLRLLSEVKYPTDIHEAVYIESIQYSRLLSRVVSRNLNLGRYGQMFGEV